MRNPRGLLNFLIPVLGSLSVLLLIGSIIRGKKFGSKNADKTPSKSLTERITRPIPALPVDVFRILAGLLSFKYFWWLDGKAEVLSAPDGLIDHRLSRRVFPYTKLNILIPGLPRSFFHTLYRAALGLSMLIVLGIWPRLSAVLLFVISVAAYRWHFMVISVEDTIIHLTLFWTALIPVGKTLTLRGMWKHRAGAMAQWRRVFVPGPAVRAFLGNIALVYLVAGLWKWTSRLWKQGVALYAILKTPVSRVPHFWKPRHLPLLVAGNHFALVVEPLLALLVVLPTGNPLKWALVVCAVAFHLGIISTLRIPHANIAMLAALPLVLREELAAFLGVRPGGRVGSGQGRLDDTGRIGWGFLAILTLAMLWEFRHPEWRQRAFERDGLFYRYAERLHLNPHYGHHQNPLFLVLWILGFAQSYRLVDWIDERNWHVTYRAHETRRNGIVRDLDPDDILPGGLRGAFFKTYLHGVPWRKVKPDDLAAIQQTLFERIAARYCRRYPDTGQVTVYASLQRTTPDNLALDQPTHQMLMRFESSGGQAHLLETALTLAAAVS